MKKQLLISLFLCFSHFLLAQENPTLGVGLESLTMKKGTIDVEVLTEIIADKQKELKEEALKRFMLKLFPETNYTTKYYIQNSLNLLLNEKNPEVIEKEILELTTNYALALGTAYAFYEKDNDNILSKVDYEQYKKSTGLYQEEKIENYISLSKENEGNLFKSSVLKKEFELYNQDKKLSDTNSYANIFVSKDSKLKDDRVKYNRLKEKIFKIKQRRGIGAKNKHYQKIKELSINFYKKINEAEKNECISEAKKSNITKHLKNLQLIKVESEIEEIKDVHTKKDLSNYLNLFKIKNLVNDTINIRNPKNSDIPFGLLVDVVSASLSNIKELRIKGFFKNKIDYRDSKFYQNLSINSKGDRLKKQLDQLFVDVKTKVTPYVKYYDVIRELIKETNLSDKESSTIITILQNKAIDLIFKDSNFSKDSTGTNSITNGLNSNISGIKERRTLRGLISDITTYQKDLVITMPSSLENILEAKKLINDIISINEKLKSLEEKSKQIKLYELSNFIVNKDVDKEKNENIITNYTTVRNALNQIQFEQIDVETYFLFNDYSEIIKNNPENTTLLKIQNIARSLIPVRSKIDSLSYIYQKVKDKKEIEFPWSIDTSKVTLLKKKIEDIYQKHSFDNQILSILLENSIREQYRSIISNKTFLKNSLENILNLILNEDIILYSKVEKDTVTINRTAKLLTELYTKIDNIYRTDDFTLSDIEYLDSSLKNALIELKLKHPFQNNTIYNKLKNFTVQLSPLLKIKKLEDVKNLGKYDESLQTLFEFIANLNNLDKAETFKSIVDMLRTGSEEVEENLPDTKFKESYLLFINAMKKYTLINVDENYVEVDVASFLTDLEVYFNRNDASRFSLYLSLGLNQNLFFGDDRELLGIDGEINNIGFASEKLGLRLRLHSFNRYGGYENAIKDDIYLNKKAPFINDLYAIVYGSGLLYSLANTSTNENFDFPHIGFGAGFQFYNALDVNFTVGFPFIKNERFGDNAFIGMGFDIPLGEYLEKLGNK